jgi:hypothetical protein
MRAHQPESMLGGEGDFSAAISLGVGLPRPQEGEFPPIRWPPQN